MKKEWKSRNCARCGRKFIPWNTPQKYCGDPCPVSKKLTIADINKAWLERDMDKRHKKKHKFSKEVFENSRVRIT